MRIFLIHFFSFFHFANLGSDSMRIRNRIKNVFAIFIAFMLVSLAGCVTNEDKVTPTTTPLITETIPPVPIETTKMPAPTGTSGITYEEHLRITPPPPRNLVGEFKMSYIYLKW